MVLASVGAGVVSSRTAGMIPREERRTSRNGRSAPHPILAERSADHSGRGRRRGGGWWLHRARPAAQKSRQEAGDKAVPVRLAGAATADFPVALTGLGTVQAISSVVVRTQVGGQIQCILFREGQMVKQGDLLVEIDPRPLQAALAQAEAKRDQDQATLGDAELNLTRLQELTKSGRASRRSPPCPRTARRSLPRAG